MGKSSPGELGDKVITYDKNYNITQLYQSIIESMRDRQHSYQYYNCDDIDQYYLDYVIKGGEINDFYNETKEYMDLYTRIGPAVITIDMTGNKKNITTSNSMTGNDLVRLQIISEFLKTCSRYIDIQYYPSCSMTVKNTCYNCGELVGRMIDDEWLCECGYVTYRCLDSRSDNNTESAYRPIVTFVKEVINFQGKEGIPLPPELISRLDEYFNAIGIPREWVLQQPYDQYGKRYGTSLQLLNDALRELGYNKLYKRANYIGREYWGWILYDLDDIMDDIMLIYQLTQEAYKTIFDRTRKSNISTQGTLLRILEIVGLKVNEKDFKLCTTRDSKEECEYLWREMCRIAGIPYYRHF